MSNSTRLRLWWNRLNAMECCGNCGYPKFPKWGKHRAWGCQNRVCARYGKPMSSASYWPWYRLLWKPRPEHVQRGRQ